MSRRRNRHGAGSALVLIMVAGYFIRVHGLELVKLLYWLELPLAFLLTAGATYKASLAIRRHRLAHALSISGVDMMSGLEFELYVAQLLTNLGYSRVKLTETYDLGVDIIAQDEDVRWGIQVKRHSGLVKAEAVRQVVTGLNVYGCDRSMVITNSTFSDPAVRLANSNNCVLVDRNKLIELIDIQDN